MDYTPPETSLAVISKLADERESENQLFVSHLKKMDPEKTDQLVQQINKAVSADIDCTKCGNCCRSLMIQVEHDEIATAAASHSITPEKFESRYLEKSTGGQLIINQIPCHFLEENRCSIYQNRFSSCREFPPLHLPGFHRRLFALMFHYGKCPIVFNVIEVLKSELNFHLPD